MENLSIDKVNQLRHSARSLVRELGLLNEAYFDIGVTLAERHLLIELSTIPYLTAKEIAERLHLEKSTVSRLIARAEKKGYIQCLSDEKDKRKRLLSLTERGQKTLNAFEEIAFQQTNEALQTLTTPEVETIHRGVALYSQGLKNSRCQETFPKQIPPESLDELYNKLHQSGYSLERYQPEDEQPLYRIFKEVVDSGCQFPYESSSMDEFHLQFFSPNSQVYICRSSIGEVIGGFYLKANYPGRSSHIANAAYMIKATHQGKGIGTLLIKASLHMAKNQGFQAMQYNMVLSQNRIAVQLYQKLGFRILGTIPNAIRNPDASYSDGYLMHRSLEEKT